jgi:hypothetical protein
MLRPADLQEWLPHHRTVHFLIETVDLLSFDLATGKSPGPDSVPESVGFFVFC